MPSRWQMVNQLKESSSCSAFSLSHWKNFSFIITKMCFGRFSSLPCFFGVWDQISFKTSCNNKHNILHKHDRISHFRRTFATTGFLVSVPPKKQIKRVQFTETLLKHTVIKFLLFGCCCFFMVTPDTITATAICYVPIEEHIVCILHIGLVIIIFRNCNTVFSFGMWCQIALDTVYGIFGAEARQ